MFTKNIAVFVAAVVLVTVSPALAQSSDLLSSAERLALTTEVGQDQSVVRRRRSGGLAWTGGVLAVGGIVLALRPPICELITTNPSLATSSVDAVYRDGRCDLRYGGQYRSTGDAIVPFEGYDTITKKTWNYVGWATAAAGGALMLFGLRSVEVPVRFDVAPAGGFRVSRSLGW